MRRRVNSIVIWLSSSSMRERRFYNLALLLPLVVSAACLGFLSVGFRLPQWLLEVIGLTAYSGLVAGIPYVVLIVLLLVWGRGRTDKQFRWALILSPILMLPIFALFIVVFVLIVDRQSLGRETLPGLLFYVPFILGYGYAYVALALTGLFIFRRLGVISNATPYNKSLGATGGSVFRIMIAAAMLA